MNPKPIYLYITPFFPSPESWRGGYCLDAAKAIVRDGRYDVHVIVTGKGEDYEWEGLRVMRMRRMAAPCGLFPFVLNWINNLVFIRRIEKAGVRVSDVAICHVNTLSLGHYADYFKRINPNVKCIIQFHSSYSLELRSGRVGLVPIHATMLYFYYRQILSRVDLLAFVSGMSKQTFGKRYVGTPEGEIKDVRSVLLFGKLFPNLRLPKQTVVYNGVDTTLFYAKQKLQKEGLVIGCVANFQPLKDHITLLKAVNIIKDRIAGLKVRLIGSGVTLGVCKAYVAQNGLSEIVSFEEEIDHRDLPDFYRSLDLFVLPSRLEGFLCVCVESWACGVPSIFCENISLAELVPEDEKSKWLFRPCDAKDLAKKIVQFFINKSPQHFKEDLEINGIWKEFLDGLEIK